METWKRIKFQHFEMISQNRVNVVCFDYINCRDLLSVMIKAGCWVGWLWLGYFGRLFSSPWWLSYKHVLKGSTYTVIHIKHILKPFRQLFSSFLGNSSFVSCCTHTDVFLFGSCLNSADSYHPRPRGRFSGLPTLCGSFEPMDKKDLLLLPFSIRGFEAYLTICLIVGW